MVPATLGSKPAIVLFRGFIRPFGDSTIMDSFLDTLGLLAVRV